MNSTSKFLFPPGQIVATPGAIRALMIEGCGTAELLSRHLTGDWGDVSHDDAMENEFAVIRELRIFSSYVLPKTKTKIWVITEADRSATTLLLPDEY